MHSRVTRHPGRKLGLLLAALLTWTTVHAVSVRADGSATGSEPAGAAKAVTGVITAPLGAATYCASPASGFGVVIPGVRPGKLFTLEARDGVPTTDIDISFWAADPCAKPAVRLTHQNRFGTEQAIVPEQATHALVTLNSGANVPFEYREENLSNLGPRRHGSPTVIAVIEPFESGFNPYHYDFAGHQHPWNADGEADIDFRAHPSTYISGYPTTPTALNITVPTIPDADVAKLAADDSDVWATMQASAGSANPQLYWFPGTKIIAAGVWTAPGYFGGNDAHGTMVAASAAGNIHGTCPECLLVLLKVNRGTMLGALNWATRQPWIDVVNNSWESATASAAVRDGIATTSEPATTRPAVERGQSVVWASGNGFVNLEFDPAPQSTYTSSQKGPDWIVTVGMTNDDGQNMSNSGKPVDIVAPGRAYPSTGGTTVTGKGFFSGTSNAAPVVAGTIGKIIQTARNLLEDGTGGAASGVVAEGTLSPPYLGADGTFHCGDAAPDCPLRDGKVTRAEVQSTLFGHVHPEPPRIPPTAEGTVNQGSDWPTGTLPTGPAPYVLNGHGVVYGQADPTRLALVNRRFEAALLGNAAPFRRPLGEDRWMKADSMNRQHLWGSWDGGYYRAGEELELDPVADAAAVSLHNWVMQGLG